ncbi:hypothetical protein N665_0026s0011 [Sinapis alba]|nr:hypothetical protein N665_0026s0011 [Sinapis alba]
MLINKISLLSPKSNHAEKTAVFVDETAKKDPTLKISFTECQKAYLAVVTDLKRANKKSDKASTTLKEMNVQMEKLLDLAAGAADAVDDDDENTHRRV